MKHLGRAVSWLITRLIDLLIWGKDMTPIPDPDEDDWPPDGSMHFIRLDPPYRYAGLPPNTVQYQFAPNLGEYDPVVFTLGREMIFRLCDFRRTLIKLTFEPEPSKYLRRKTAMRPVEIAAQFLRSLVPEAPVAQRECIAAVLSNGCPKELFTQFEAALNIVNHSIDFIDLYLFPDENTPLDPEEGLSLVEQGGYQVELSLEYGPSALNVVFDPESLDIAEVEKVVAEVCHAHNILLADPFSPPEIKE